MSFHNSPAGNDLSAGMKKKPKIFRNAALIESGRRASWGNQEGDGLMPMGNMTLARVFKSGHGRGKISLLLRINILLSMST
jgi:hypothetical protein